MVDYWRWTALVTYLIICVYDFVVVPVWYGLSRVGLNVDSFMANLQLIDDPMVQMEYLKKLVSQHDPFTLQGGGLFHLAFGALLTGSALGKKSK